MMPCAAEGTILAPFTVCIYSGGLTVVFLVIEDASEFRVLIVASRPKCQLLPVEEILEPLCKAVTVRPRRHVSRILEAPDVLVLTAADDVCAPDRQTSRHSG